MLFPVALFASALFLQQTPPAAPASAPPPAQTPAATPQSAAATTLPTVTVAGAPVEPTVTCRMETVTGSRFGRRVCRNAVQTAEEEAQSREMLRRLQGARTPDM